MQLDLTGELFFWRGPAPWHFVAVPAAGCAELRAIAGDVSYGWGVIPVAATLGATTWTTSLFPKDGGYLVPAKTAVRRAEQVDLGDIVAMRLRV